MVSHNGWLFKRLLAQKNVTVLLLAIYAKSVRASIPGALLKQIKEVLDHDD